MSPVPDDRIITDELQALINEDIGMPPPILDEEIPDDSIMPIKNEPTDFIIRAKTGELVFVDQFTSITLRDISMMRDVIRRLREEIDYLKNIQEL